MKSSKLNIGDIVRYHSDKSGAIYTMEIVRKDSAIIRTIDYTNVFRGKAKTLVPVGDRWYLKLDEKEYELIQPDNYEIF